MKITFTSVCGSAESAAVFSSTDWTMSATAFWL